MSKVKPPSPVPGYSFSDVLSAKGCFGTVYKAMHTSTKKIVAVKQIHYGPEESRDGLPKQILREISLLHMFNPCPHIVRLLDTHQRKNKAGELVYSLVFEWMDTDLEDFIKVCVKEDGRVHPDIVKELMWQLLTGVSAIHSHSAMHRDLRPSNLLLLKDSNCLKLKIADFGSSRLYNIPTEEYSVHCTYMSYKAPEILKKEKEYDEASMQYDEEEEETVNRCARYTVSADIWSVGCIFGELATGKRLFINMEIEDDTTGEGGQTIRCLDVSDVIEGVLGSAEVQLLQKICMQSEEDSDDDSDDVEDDSDDEDIEVTIDSIASLAQKNKERVEMQKKKAKLQEEKNRVLLLFGNLCSDGLDLLSKMLVYEPERRISAIDALEHPYFKSRLK